MTEPKYTSYFNIFRGDLIFDSSRGGMKGNEVANKCLWLVSGPDVHQAGGAERDTGPHQTFDREATTYQCLSLLIIYSRY